MACEVKLHPPVRAAEGPAEAMPTSSSDRFPKLFTGDLTLRYCVMPGIHSGRLCSRIAAAETELKIGLVMSRKGISKAYLDLLLLRISEEPVSSSQMDPEPKFGPKGPGLVLGPSPLHRFCWGVLVNSGLALHDVRRLHGHGKCFAPRGMAAPLAAVLPVTARHLQRGYVETLIGPLSPATAWV